jgi:PTS system cellobiose-specific IIB component
MTRVLLVCNAGVSTGIMAKKMQDVRPDTIKVCASSNGDYMTNAENADVLLIGPQIRFMEEEIRSNVNIPVMVMDFRKYGLMDAKGILEDMDKLLEG